MNALERVKYVLGQLPREDQEEIAAFLRERLAGPGGAAERAATVPLVATVREGRRGGKRRGGAVTYRVELVRCGKDSCAKCPHGPYSYKYWREGGTLRKAYLGKALLPAPPEPERGKP